MRILGLTPVLRGRVMAFALVPVVLSYEVTTLEAFGFTL
jgi:hypothetical protein